MSPREYLAGIHSGLIRLYTRDCYCQTEDDFVPGQCRVCEGSGESALSKLRRTFAVGTEGAELVPGNTEACTTCGGDGKCTGCEGQGVTVPGPFDPRVISGVLIAGLSGLRVLRDQDQWDRFHRTLDALIEYHAALIEAEGPIDPDELRRQMAVLYGGELDANPLPPESALTGSALTSDELRELGIEPERNDDDNGTGTAD